MKPAAFLLALTLCAAAPLPVNKAKVLGPVTAPVRIEVYSSFACTHCKAFHDTLLPRLKMDFVASGKACVVSRECFHPSSAAAREAANFATAAARIGKYQQVSDALFREQEKWMANGRVWDAVAVALTAAEQKKVQALAKTPAVISEVDRDLADAVAARVKATPTMIITRGSRSYPFEGLPSYDLLQSLIGDLLKK